LHVGWESLPNNGAGRSPAAVEDQQPVVCGHLDDLVELEAGCPGGTFEFGDVA
jgi:hypothetical protein